jgi:hypothetical protein
MAKVKGVALLSRLAIIKEHYGDETLNKIISELDEESRTLLTGGSILSSSWYPAEIYRDINTTIYKQMRSKEPKVLETLGALTAEMGMTTIHKSKVKENRPDETIRRIPMLWSAFHDTGTVEIIQEPNVNKALFRVTGYELPHKEFCLNLMGWARKIIELSGGNNVDIRETKCVCNGDPVCEMVITWS